MRTGAKIAAVLSSGAVLLAGWQLGEQGDTSTAAVADSTSSSADTSASPRSTGTGSATGTSAGTGSDSGSTPAATATPEATATPDDAATPDGAATAASAGDGTFTGDSVSTRFGDVQVSVAVSGRVITDVTPLHLTDKESRSAQISARAAPVLREEVLAAQSADVANVSGATYTSDAYLQSLQSALEQAGR